MAFTSDFLFFLCIYGAWIKPRPGSFFPPLYEYTDTDSAGTDMYMQTHSFRHMCLCYTHFPHEQMCIAFDSTASLGASACMWWMIQRIKVVCVTYEVLIVVSPRTKKLKCCHFPHVATSTHLFFHCFTFFAYNTCGSIQRPRAIWSCFGTTSCPPSQTIIIALQRSHLVTDLSVMRHWAEVTAVTVLLPHPRVLWRFVPGAQHYPTWLCSNND